jgi:hypothetical protein
MNEGERRIEKVKQRKRGSVPRQEENFFFFTLIYKNYTKFCRNKRNCNLIYFGNTNFL